MVCWLPRWWAHRSLGVAGSREKATAWEGVATQPVQRSVFTMKHCDVDIRAGLPAREPGFALLLLSCDLELVSELLQSWLLVCRAETLTPTSRIIVTTAVAAADCPGRGVLDRVRSGQTTSTSPRKTPPVWPVQHLKCCPPSPRHSVCVQEAGALTTWTFQRFHLKAWDERSSPCSLWWRRGAVACRLVIKSSSLGNSDQILTSHFLHWLRLICWLDSVGMLRATPAS